MVSNLKLSEFYFLSMDESSNESTISGAAYEIDNSLLF